MSHRHGKLCRRWRLQQVDVRFHKRHNSAGSRISHRINNIDDCETPFWRTGILNLRRKSDPFPEEIEPEFYRAQEAALARFGKRAIQQHFRNYGRHEGRLASPAAVREGFVPLFDEMRPLLEIGPFDAPMATGPSVAYFDIMDQKALSEWAARLGRTGDIPTIDYVSAIGDLSIVPEKFKAVCSAHVVEHQPDLIDHLEHVARLLAPQGCYFLVIPDKRYCFDHFIPESTVDDVVLSHKERRKTYSMANVFRHISQTTHNDALRHWNGDHKDADYDEQMPVRIEAARKVYKEDIYIDVHAWQFTPDSFRVVFGELSKRRLIPFELVRVYDTPKPYFEFTAILRKMSQSNGSHVQKPLYILFLAA